jgi:hypothetical protein
LSVCCEKLKNKYSNSRKSEKKVEYLLGIVYFIKYIVYNSRPRAGDDLANDRTTNIVLPEKGLTAGAVERCKWGGKKRH